MMGLEKSNGAVASIDNVLPAEKLERRRVSRRWREVGEAPGLWAWVASVHWRLSVTRRNLSVVPGMLD